MGGSFLCNRATVKPHGAPVRIQGVEKAPASGKTKKKLAGLKMQYFTIALFVLYLGVALAAAG